MDWRHKAACLNEDPELFFPIGNTGPALAQIEEAKKVCQRCEVREECLAWALEAGQDHDLLLADATGGQDPPAAVAGSDAERRRRHHDA